MKKINVIGTTGSGKSTFSEQLAEKLGYPYVQMDQVFWKPNWAEPSDEEFFPKLKAAISGNSWVLDGNYNRSNDIKWQDADTIIWIDYSFFRTLFQLFKRTINRATSKQELWPGTGNKESFRKSFLSRKSILVWFFKNYHRNKIRYAKLKDLDSLTDIHFVRLRNPREAQIFIESL